MTPNPNDCLIECNTGRLSRFLAGFTNPLLSLPQKQEMIDIFSNLVDVCFQGAQPTSQWTSHLSFDGTPLEFSLALSSDDDISFRFLADTTFLPDEDSRSEPVMRTRSHRVVPYSSEGFELIDRIFERYLKGRGYFPRNSVVLGARFGHERNRQAGRIYFSMPVGSPEVLGSMLDLCAHRHTRECIEAAPLLRDRILGLCCDFGQHGPAAIKVYAFVEDFARDQMLATASDLLGLEASRLDALLDVVCSFKESWWRVPPTLVGLSQDVLSDRWRVDLHFPLMAWDWSTLASVRTAISAILTRWGFPAITAPAANAYTAPHWRFRPTFLSIGVSEDGTEDLASYFKPVKILHPEDLALSEREIQAEQSREYSPSKKAQGLSGSTVFAEMYSELLRAESTQLISSRK